jgi:hypothetical protein
MNPLTCHDSHQKGPYLTKTLRTAVILGWVGASGATLLLTSGEAAASPDMSGKTYSQAQSELVQMGYTAIAQVVIGDKTAQGDCKVIRQQDLPSAISGWSTSQLSTNGVFVGGDQPTLYPIKVPGIPTPGRVMLTLACYRAKDASAAHLTGSGDVNTKKPQ